MSAQIDRLLPEAANDASDHDLLAWYDVDASHSDGAPWVRLNFVSSADGAATRNGLSGGLGDEADRRVFELLRYLADVVLVGAGTVRAEGYGPMALSAEAVAWRTANGLAPQPVFAIASGSALLDPASPVFTEAPVRPLVFTTGAGAASNDALAAVADVVVTAPTGPRLDAQGLVDGLRERGLRRVHCEGGPTFAGTLLDAGLVDELDLTLAATLEGGGARRILSAPLPAEQSMRLALLLRSESTLLMRYVRG